MVCGGVRFGLVSGLRALFFWSGFFGSLNFGWGWERLRPGSDPRGVGGVLVGLAGSGEWCLVLCFGRVRPLSFVGVFS